MLNLTLSMPMIAIDDQLSVKQRLAQLAAWRAAYDREEARLLRRVHLLDPDKSADVQKGAQIASLRRQLRLQLVEEPLALPAEMLQQGGYQALRANLAGQFAALSCDQRRAWLMNLLFVVTPDLRKLNAKIGRVRGHLQFGQQRNFLLGGVSGSGKTTYLDFLAFHARPRVEVERNLVPIIKIDAPVSNHTPKPLLQRIILACGYSYLERENEEYLLMKLALYFQKCGVDLLVVDEVGQLKQHAMRRRLLEISNLTTGVPILCAACNPQSFTDNDPEIAGRWNDDVLLPQFTGEKLRELLAFVDVLLPFPEASQLDLYEIATPAGKVDGPAKLVERCTGGVLRDIMILIADASLRAIERGDSQVSPALLAAAWADLQTRRVTDFLAVVA